MEFRLLEAHEIDCRVATVKANGVSLLLYKDARVDMNILDESVGAMNWERKHTRDNANCIVGIWDETKKQWITKEDTGAESFTEKEKGLASDSFKRACFNWGIGRELYTAPFVWISDVKTTKKGERHTTFDRFKVIEIGYTNKIISKLIIANAKDNRIVYKFDASKTTQEVKKDDVDRIKEFDKVKKELNDLCAVQELDKRDIMKQYNITAQTDTNEFKRIIELIKKGI
jgi:hypothetical protein